MSATGHSLLTAPSSGGGTDHSTRTFRLMLLVSATLHIGAFVVLYVMKGMSPTERPPVYRIELVGAAGLKKQMGIVADKQPPAPAAPEPTKAPAAAERPPEAPKAAPPPKTKTKPVPKPVKATPNVTKDKAAAKDAPKTSTTAAPPVAGSGNVKGRGTDVTNMVVEGIQFPYPGYLENISRQIILQFNPAKGSAYVAEVRFVIHRDGSVTDIEVLKGSGNRAFDLEARGAIEAAGNSRAFRPLPAGFNDDVLPVYFTFSPATTPPPEL